MSCGLYSMLHFHYTIRFWWLRCGSSACVCIILIKWNSYRNTFIAIISIFWWWWWWCCCLISEMFEAYEDADSTHIHTFTHSSTIFCAPHSFSSKVKIGAHIQLMMVAHIFAHFVSFVDGNQELNKFGISFVRFSIPRVLFTHESIS